MQESEPVRRIMMEHSEGEREGDNLTSVQNLDQYLCFTEEAKAHVAVPNLT